MSFSSEVKAELSKTNNLKNKDEVFAELNGYLITSNISNLKNEIRFSTENEYNINRFAKLLNNTESSDYKIEIQGKTYSITFKDKIKKVDYNNILQEDRLKKAFIKGTFLGSGSINEPKSNYHLEIIFLNNEGLRFTKKIIESYDINVKTLEDNKIYIKDGEEISKFLALIGASMAVLKFEETRVLREMKNNVNRIVNCETANLNKTIDASVEQIDLIKQIKNNGKFETMPDDLKEISNLRLDNPNATLVELGNMLKKPIGKSSVSHRFKRIKEYL